MRPLSTDAHQTASCSGRHAEPGIRGMVIRPLPNAGLSEFQKHTVLHGLELIPRPRSKLWPEKPRLLYVGRSTSGPEPPSSPILVLRLWLERANICCSSQAVSG